MPSFFRGLRKAVKSIARQPRAHPRVMISEPIALTTPQSLGQKAILEDISVGGACIRTHIRLRPGDQVSMLLNLGVGKHVDARGRVVYALASNSGFQTRYGLRFLGLDERAVNEIQEFVIDQKFGRQFGVRSFYSSYEREQQ
jgi:c-di-GMP-binding flagellar brake protein YcgR